MINIKRKEDCVGCNACVQRCPKQCISMNEDEQGFLYPKVDIHQCIECGLCEKVCPVINQGEPREPLAVYAAMNKDEQVLINSSSGGVFHALAKWVIEDGGVVFGAKFNDRWEVVHDFTETMDGIKAFQTSKYVQSRIGETFIIAERFLKDGRQVLFSGTPCQIAGLKRFLKKEYDNLIAVDVICHGVPSPQVWRKYLEFITRAVGASKNTESRSNSHHLNEIPVITGISFRDKRLGWEKFGIAIHFAAPKGGRNSESQSTISQQEDSKEFFETFSKNLFMRGFLENLCLRQSCFHCPSKCGKSYSDLSLADYWCIYKVIPVFYHKKGVSLILSMTDKGQLLLDKINFNICKTSYKDALRNNPAIISSAKKPVDYLKFWSEYNEMGLKALENFDNAHRPSLKRKVENRIKSYIKPIYIFLLQLIKK